MNLAKIKAFYSELPLPIRNILLRVPYDYFLGQDYSARKALIEDYQRLDARSAEAQANQFLFNYVNDAIVDTPFYRDFSRSRGIKSIRSVDDFLEFPVISKEQVNENLEWFSNRNEENKFIVTTGGTTGKQLKLYMSNNAYREEWAYKYWLLRGNGIDINAKRICLKGIDFGEDESVVKYNPLYKELLISPFRLNKTNIEEVLSKIRIFKPTWVHGYPSSVSHFSKLAASHDMTGINLSLALLVSEKVYASQIEEITSMLGLRIATFYGMTERVIFAPNDADGNLVPDFSYGFTESIEGQLVGTGYLNSATRLIRYATGDEAEVDCSYSRVTAISELVGRWGGDVLVGSGGEVFNMTALNIHTDILKQVDRYQFVQSQAGECELLLMAGSMMSLSTDVAEKVRLEFQRKVGPSVAFRVKVVNNISLTVRGKHRFIVSNI